MRPLLSRHRDHERRTREKCVKQKCPRLKKLCGRVHRVGAWLRDVAPDDGVRELARATAAQAQWRLQTIPDLWFPTAPDLVPVNVAAIPPLARTGLRQFAGLLATVVGLLLAAGCMTVGMLLLVRTEARRDELAMCLALGGSRANLARGILIEGTLLSWAGAACRCPLPCGSSSARDI